MRKVDILMKKIVSLILILIVLFALMVPVAVASENAQTEKAVVADYYDVSPRWEQTQWVFRVDNGRLYQRLWSITFGRWLTDWQLIGW